MISDQALLARTAYHGYPDMLLWFSLNITITFSLTSYPVLANEVLPHHVLAGTDRHSALLYTMDIPGTTIEFARHKMQVV